MVKVGIEVPFVESYALLLFKSDTTLK
jgi:hypothetical protein